MRKPKEVQLKYKNDGNGIIALLVDPAAGVTYKWQHCKAKTANWETVNATNNNTYIINNPLIGDKYRCLIVSGKKVVSYSKVLTIGQNKFRSKNEYNSKTQYTYQKPFPSVEDTDGMDGLEFATFCADILKKSGFCDIQVTQGSGDYGIDILAKKESISYAIQCKCYTTPVGNKAVQEAFSGKAFYNCMVAVVMTNNYFTDAAIETAKRNAVVLWNRDYLDEMIKNCTFDGDAQRETDRKEKTRHEQAHRERQQNSQKEQYQRQQKSDSAVPDFFKGCSSWEQIKERYRKLMQMYHPDHEAGDEEYAKIINDQYSKLKKQYDQ